MSVRLAAIHYPITVVALRFFPSLFKKGYILNPIIWIWVRGRPHWNSAGRQTDAGMHTWAYMHACRLRRDVARISWDLFLFYSWWKPQPSGPAKLGRLRGGGGGGGGGMGHAPPGDMHVRISCNFCFYNVSLACSFASAPGYKLTEAGYIKTT